MVRACERSRRYKKFRFCIFRSNMHIYAQIIDDLKGYTLVSASTKELNSSKTLTRSNMSNAVLFGDLIGKKALEKGITENIMFDRRSYRYAGIVRAVADAARKVGLKF